MPSQKIIFALLIAVIFAAALLCLTSNISSFTLLWLARLPEPVVRLIAALSWIGPVTAALFLLWRRKITTKVEPD
jgi:hypothetical protein